MASKKAAKQRCWHIDVGEADVNESDVRRQDEEVLRRLLIDRTMTEQNGRVTNIRWCTGDYCAERGQGFDPDDEMQIDQIADATAEESLVIMPRFRKNREDQRKRSVEKAEVFTPCWVCNAQNNLVDAAWFGREERLFNVENDKYELELAWYQEELAKDVCRKVPLVKPVRWRTLKGRSNRVRFPRDKSHSWKAYVAARRLEVSCGEAPYLTSRYDTTDGAWIEPCNRIGLLDRKLRVIGERYAGKDPAEWIACAKTALQSCYGFEWQGDNVLLARENMLYAVLEAFDDDFSGQRLMVETVREFAEIISWNIFQMDGIKFVVPNTCGKRIDLAGPQPCEGCRKKSNSPKDHNGFRCLIKDWATGEVEEFVPNTDKVASEKGVR